MSASRTAVMTALSTVVIVAIAYEVAIIPWRYESWNERELVPLADAHQKLDSTLKECNERVSRCPQDLPPQSPGSGIKPCEFALTEDIALNKNQPWSTVLSCPDLAGRRAQGKLTGTLRVACAGNAASCPNDVNSANLSVVFGRSIMTVGGSGPGGEAIPVANTVSEEFRVPLAGQFNVRIEVNACGRARRRDIAPPADAQPTTDVKAEPAAVLPLPADVPKEPDMPIPSLSEAPSPVDSAAPCVLQKGSIIRILPL